MCLISNKGVLPFPLHAYGFVYLSECLLFSRCKETTVGLFVADLLVCCCSLQFFISQTPPPSISLSGLLFGITEATQLVVCIIIAVWLLLCLFDSPLPLIEWGDGGGKSSCFSHHVFMHCDLRVPAVKMSLVSSYAGLPWGLFGEVSRQDIMWMFTLSLRCRFATKLATNWTNCC